MSTIEAIHDLALKRMCCGGLFAHGQDQPLAKVVRYDSDN